MKRVLLLCTLVAGCSFPSISAVVPEDAQVDSGLSDSASEGGPDDSSIDSSTDAEDETLADSTIADGDASSDAKPDTLIDSFIPDADAGMCPSGSPGTDTCDCDNDGEKRKGSPCGGLDCDDNDARANTKVSMFLTFSPTTKTAGDWNCDGTPVKQYDESVSCAALIDLGACAKKKGFTAVVACGASGTLVTCKTSGLSCIVGTSITDVQGCK